MYKKYIRKTATKPKLQQKMFKRINMFFMIFFINSLLKTFLENKRKRPFKLYVLCTC